MANGIEAVVTAETFPHRTWGLPSTVAGLLRFCREEAARRARGTVRPRHARDGRGGDAIADYADDQSIPGARMQAPSARFWMGTDNLSRARGAAWSMARASR